ncbi:MAG: class I SAM-dependent methyltransferase, partial [Planctomycetes bacterium]|nr:class I SAM-dependent methyltransferase [Planctomycetota bacterium]
GKRAEFLEEALMRLELFNVEVFSGQAEEELREEGEVDLIVARAVEAPGKLLQRIRRNKVRFGTLFLMAGPRFDEDWDSLSDEVRRSWKLAARHPYTLPGDRGARQVAVLKPA